MGEEHRTRLTREVHKTLVAAFRMHPGRFGVVARLAQVDKRTARKAWVQGLPYEWGKTPISEMIAAEQAQARELLAERQPAPSHVVDEDELGDAGEGEDQAAPQASPARRESKAEAIARAAVEARAQEGQLVQLTRSNALVQAALSSEMYKTGAALTVRLNTAIEERFFRRDVNGKLAPLTIEEIEKGMMLMQRLASFSKMGATVGDLCLDMERKLLGDGPTSPADAMSKEQALLELAEAKRAFERVEERAKARGVLVIQDGSTPS